MATRTTTTSRISTARGPFADSNVECADFSFEELVQAYFDCRRTKRNTPNALAFEVNLERNLVALAEDLRSGAYRPGRSICFVITHPKAREVWAADFRDRIVHHLLYNRVGPAIQASFIADSCACIEGRGTTYAVRRLEAKVRSITENWSVPAYYLKCDLANFFVSIDKSVLREQIARRVKAAWWMNLAEMILMHDPRENYQLQASPELMARVPMHKRLTSQPTHLGLPIGNLSSQFFANIYLNALDQHVKHQLRARHYVRYVDDFIVLHRSKDYLVKSLADIEQFLSERLHARLNPTKTILQPVDRGIDFVGQVVKPWRTTTRAKTVRYAIKRISTEDKDDVSKSANSYFGLLRQAGKSRRDRAALAHAILRRGLAVDGGFTKAFKGASK
jgi:RNA-directed DNA polymerase